MKRIVMMAAIAIAGCAASARTQYGMQLDACIDHANSRAEADVCLEKVRAMWTKAGAPEAAQPIDGGSQ